MDTFIDYLHSLPDCLIYLLLGMSAFVENIFPPIPGDTIIAFGAYLLVLTVRPEQVKANATLGVNVG